EQAKIAAAAHRQLGAEYLQRGRRYLEQLVAGPLDAKGTARRLGDAIAIMPNRIDGRIVEETHFRQDIDGPGRVPHDAERRCPVADDRFADHLLQSILTLAQILAERVGGQVMQALVIPAMTGDLVSRAMDGANQFRVVLCNLSHEKERGVDAALAELLQ